MGAVYDFGHVLAVGAGVAVLDDAGAGFDQAAQDRLLRNDFGVVAGIGRGGDRLGQGDEVGGPPMRLSSPRRSRVAETVTGSAGSPRP